MKNHRARLAALALVLGCAGCATKIPSYPGQPAGQVRSAQAQGLLLKVDPFADRARAETYFKLDPADKGLAILHLRAENQSADATWLLTEQGMALVDHQASSSASGSQGVKDTLVSPNTVSVLAATLGPLPLLQLGYTQTFVEKNLVDKAWRNQTLSPGQSAQGFLYFNANKNSDWLKRMSLRVECLNVRNQQTTTVLIPLAYEQK